MFHSFGATGRIVLMGLAAVLASSSAWGQAAIEGKVKLSSDAPKAVLNQRYQVKAGEVAPPAPPLAVVYLEGSFLTAGVTNESAKAEMPQQGFQFATSVLPVMKGTTVTFPNRDDGYHNVFSYSKVKRFDLGRYRKDEMPAAVVFDQAGVVKLYCEIHEHMRAVILVLDTPHFTSTDPEGSFKLEKLPAGTFTLKVWLDEKHVLEKPVTLKEGETLHVDFTAP